MLEVRNRSVRTMLLGALLFGGSLVSLAQPVSLPAELFSNPPAPSSAALQREDRLKLAIAVNMESAAAWTDLGWRLYRNGRYGQSAYVMSEARRLAPNDPYVLWLSGLASYATGQFVEAKQHLWRLFSENKGWPTTVDMGVTYDLLGRLFLEEGKLFEAAYFLSKSADAHPNNWQVHFVLGVTEWFRENYGSSLKSLAQARRLRPRDPLVLQYYAAAKLAVGERHIHATEKALELNLYPEAAKEAQQAKLEFDADINVIRDAIAAAPQNPENFELLGRYHVARKDTPSALAALRQAIRLPGARASTRYILAKTLLSIGTPATNEEAKQLLIDAVAQSPGYWEGAREAPHVGLLIALLLSEGSVAQARSLVTWIEAQ